MFCAKFVVIKIESAACIAFNMFTNKMMLIWKCAIRPGPLRDWIMCFWKCFSAMDKD
jgi:hypothetical protein